MCKYFQESVKKLSVDYYNTLLRHNYVTPTSYLELILTFKTLLNSKRQEVDTIRNRYLAGLQKLEFASSQVSTCVEQARRARICWVCLDTEGERASDKDRLRPQLIHFHLSFR
jgi:hypothetical protein